MLVSAHRWPPGGWIGFLGLAVTVACAVDPAPPDAALSDGGTVDVGDRDAAWETGLDAGRDAGAPTVCVAGAACAGWFDGTACDGVCVTPRTAPYCAGTVFDGLCEGANVMPPVSDTYDADGLRVAVLRAPERAHVGETHEFEVAVMNTSAVARDIAPEFVLAASWESVSGTIGSGLVETWSLAPGQMRIAAGQLRAASPTVVAHDRVAFTVSMRDVPLGSRGFRVRVPVYDGAAGIACGDERYPDTYLSPEGSYFTGRCCEDVFYPAAQCCGPDDCTGRGQCVDGQCVADSPRLPYGSAPARGRFRILVVRLDDPAPPSGHTLCDPIPTDGFPIDLDGVEADWQTMAASYLGREGVIDFDWTVLTGLTRADVGLAVYDTTTAGLMALERAVERALTEAGCLTSFEADFDRVVFYAPEANGANVVYDTDRALVSSPHRLTLVHELAHTFGATDLYEELGGAWQYAGSLAGAGSRSLRADVTFGEVGWADTNRNAVIDAYEWVRAPTTLAARTVEAVDMSFAIELRFDFSGVDGGRVGRVLPRRVTLEVPSLGLTRTLELRLVPRESSRTMFRALLLDAEHDLSTIRRAGELEIVLRADHYGTRADGARVHASLDARRGVAVMGP